MKKASIFLSAAFIISALVSCNIEIEPSILIEPNNNQEQVGSIPFVLQANLQQTKTTLNPSTYAVSWEDGDVIYAVTTDEAWGSGATNTDPTAAAFTYSGIESSFSTESVIADGSHTFYFVYEPSSQQKYHRSAATTFSLAGTQFQNCNDATAHLKQNDALAGKLTATTPSNKLETVSLSHVNALMQFNIVNSSGEDVTLTSFDITFDGANIAGIETISFAGATPTASITSSEKDKITVNISNGDLPDGETLPIYFVMAPLSNYTGNVTVNVFNSAGGYYTKTSPISSAISFAAETYNRSTITISSWESPLTFTRINSVSEFTDGDYQYVIVGQKGASDFGVLTYGALSSGKLTYTTAYDALPATTLQYSDPNAMWEIAVSGSDPVLATLYNAENDKYLAANSNLSFVAEGSATQFSVTSEGNLFAFAQNTNFLGVNKSSNYWKDYAGSTVYASSGKVLALYRYWEDSELSSIALSGTYPTEFHQGDAFSYEGLVVRATYANGKSRIVTPTSVSTPDMSSVANDVEVTVTYTEGLITKTDTYTVDITSAATPKTITKAATANGSFVTDPDGSALPGATVTVTATPNPGYVLASISVIGEDSTPVTVTDNTFVMPDQNVTVTVVFGPYAVLSKATFTSAGVSLNTTATTVEATNTIDGVSVTFNGVSTNAKNTPTAAGASSDAQKVKTGQLVLFKKDGAGYIYNASSLTLKKVILELVGTNTNSVSVNTPTVSAKASEDPDYANVALPSPIASTRDLDAASGSTPITVNTFVYEIDMTGKNFFKIVTGNKQLNVYSITVIY